MKRIESVGQANLYVNLALAETRICELICRRRLLNDKADKPLMLALKNARAALGTQLDNFSVEFTRK